MIDETREARRRLAASAPRWATIAVAMVVTGALVAGSAEAAAPSGNGRKVVLLHGLMRHRTSMMWMASALAARGFEVCNVSYPSRDYAIEVLAKEHVAPAVRACFPGTAEPIDFVTHSMGGIVVRQLAAAGAVSSIGRVVMLGPPNGGSEIIDEIGGWWLFRMINGPAGCELGTSSESLPKRLGPATFEAGIIAGNSSRMSILSRLLPGENDGKVSVASTELAGMKDFLVLPANHTFMMRNSEVIRQTISFLTTGAFRRTVTAAAPLL